MQIKIPSPASFGSKLYSLIVQKAQHCPDDIAIISECEKITYGQLLARAQWISDCLLKKGLQPGDFVGIYLPRDGWLPSAILGVLWSGGAYLPMDPSYPSERLTYMVQHCSPVAVITSREFQSFSSVQFGETQLIPIESIEPVEDYRPLEVASGSCAYVIYTSGSTGKPKGVMVSHDNLGHFVDAVQEIINLSAQDKFFSLTPVSFDIFGLELFLPLSQGACCILGSAESRTNAELLMHLLETYRATFIQATPTTYAMLTQIGWHNDYLKGVLCGGEAWDISLAKKIIHAIPHSAKLWNMYGPTEATIWCACQQINTSDKEVLIGPPLKGNQFVLMDKDTLVEKEGELCVIGNNVAMGYLGAEKSDGFTNPPAYSSIPFYRTGDYVRRQGEQFRFISRIDRQIKLRGFRIELGEIESHIASIAQVSQAALILTDSTENAYIQAFIVCRNSDTLSEEAVRTHLGKLVPHYMIPQKISFVKNLPLTPAGKIDYKNLLNLSKESSGFAPELEEATTKMLLKQIWCELLKVNQFTEQSHFLELGGHSLLAVQMASRIRKLFSIKISLPEIFNHLIFSDLCRLIETKLEQEKTTEKLSTSDSVVMNSEFRMTDEQIDNWKYDIELAAEHAVTTPTAIMLEGYVSPERMRDAWTKVLKNNSIFHYQFVKEKDSFLQKKASFSAEGTFNYFVSNIEDIDENELVNDYINKLKGASFDLSQPPLIRASLIKIAERKYIFWMFSHHIIMDGWSKSVFFEQLAEYYRYPDSHLQEKSPGNMTWESYLIEHFAWLDSHDAKQQRNFWNRFLKSDISATHIFPHVADSKEESNFSGDVYYFQLQKKIVDQLNAFASNLRTTHFSILLAVFNITIASFNHAQKQTIATVAFNRTHKKYESVIGLLANTLLIPANIGHVPVKTFIYQIHQNSLDAIAHQELPFAEILKSANVDVAPGCDRPGNVMFLYQNIKSRNFECGDEIESQFLPLHTTNSVMDFLLEFRPQANGYLSGAIEFRNQFCTLEQVKLFVNRYQNCLEKILSDDEQDCWKLAEELCDAV